MLTRLFNQIRGRLSLFFSSLEYRNPEVLLENAKNDLRANRAKMQRGVAEMAAVSERLKRQISEGERRQKDLEGRVMVAYNAGNQALAAELAQLLAEVEADLAENRAELDSNEKAYREFNDYARAAEKDLLKKIEKLSKMISQAKAKEAAAEVAEMISGTLTGMNASSVNFDRLEEVAGGKLDQAAGRLRAATDSSRHTELRLKQEEQQIQGKAALANFLARKGIAAQAAPAAAAAPATTPSTERPPLAPKVEGPAAQ